MMAKKPAQVEHFVVPFNFVLDCEYQTGMKIIARCVFVNGATTANKMTFSIMTLIIKAYFS
jgi:hypothetical protein